jgi:predicted transglutaminase-like cysteine proteinase
VLFSIVAVGLLSGGAGAKTRPSHNPSVPASLVETTLSLAPFQHVRFCLRYPADCRSNLTEDERIELTGENTELLDRVNRDVNAAAILNGANGVSWVEIFGFHGLGFLIQGWGADSRPPPDRTA